MATTQNQNHAESMMQWPPSENTRLMLVEHMICCLSSERHSLFSKEEAAEDAKKIEDIAFVAANHHASRYPNADGSATAQLYAKEASKLMLEALKREPSAKTKVTDVREAFPEKVGVKETVLDISLGERVFVDEILARELLRPLEEPGNSYTKICFGNRSFGVEAAHVAKGILMGVQKTLTYVDLIDFAFLRPKAEALEVMSIFSSALEGCMMRYLRLQLYTFGEKGVRAFGPLLKSQKTLEELEFFDINISREAARAICEFLTSVERIKTLHFFCSQSGDDATDDGADDAAEALSELVTKCIALEDFAFQSSNIGTRGGIALAEALGKGSRLKILKLRDHMYWKRAGVALSQAISRHLGLTEVYLGYLNLEDEGAIAIANSIKDAVPSLSVLDISGNYITPKAAPALAECLAVKNLLTKFYAAENELKDDGSIVICKALLDGHDRLEQLDLSSNSLSLIGGKAAAKAVVNKPDFTWLYIDDNSITKMGIETIKYLLREGTKGDSVLSAVCP